MSPELLRILITVSILGAGVLILLYKWMEPAIRTDHVYAVLLGKDGTIKRHFVKERNKGLIINKVKYNVSEQCRYVTGRWNTGVFYYFRGKAAPIDFKQMALSGQSSDDFHEATETHVARDLLQAFNRVIDPVTAIMILGIVLLIGMGLLYYQLNKNIGEIKTAIITKSVSDEPVLGNSQ